MQGYGQNSQYQLVQHLLHGGSPHYHRRHQHMHSPTPADVLVIGMFGPPCGGQVDAFPGKVLYVNGENKRKDMTTKSNDNVYQIGMVPDKPGTVKVYFMAIALSRFVATAVELLVVDEPQTNHYANVQGIDLHARQLQTLSRTGHSTNLRHYARLSFRHKVQWWKQRPWQ